MNRIRSFIASVTVVGLGVPARLRRQEGQTLVEYSLILGLIAVVVIVVLTTLGTQVSSVFNTISNDL